MKFSHRILSSALILTCVAIIGSCGGGGGGEGSGGNSSTDGPNTPIDNDKPADPVTYTITIKDTPHGTVASDITGLTTPGKIITITVANDPGYGCRAESLSYTTDDGKKTIIHDRHFAMPSQNVTITAEFITFNVGDIGPAGGYIFYNKGSFSDGWQYMEIAPSDQSIEAKWCDSTNKVSVPTTDYVVGTGKAATDAIISALGQEGSYAVQICNNLIIDGYDDWYLPTTLEMFDAFNVCGSTGTAGFTGEYWVSRFEASSNSLYSTAEYIYWNGSSPMSCGNPNVYQLKKVRAARRF